MTYTVIARDPNSWTRTAQGDFHEITYDCGHHHRTIDAAIHCLRRIAGTTDSLHAAIEVAAEDQKYDGRVVDESEYIRAQERVRGW